MEVSRGDIFNVLFDESKGSEQSGIRPAIVVQNDIGNRYAPTVIVAPITSKTTKSKIPTHVNLTPNDNNGLKEESTVLLEQIRTFDFEKRFQDKLGKLNEDEMFKINRALAISVGLKI